MKKHENYVAILEAKHENNVYISSAVYAGYYTYNFILTAAHKYIKLFFLFFFVCAFFCVCISKFLSSKSFEKNTQIFFNSNFLEKKSQKMFMHSSWATSTFLNR